jgi:hypothetical protein
MCKSCRIDFDALDEIPDPLHYRLALALALARYTDRTREAWPAIRTLAEMVKKPRQRYAARSLQWTVTAISSAITSLANRPATASPHRAALRITTSEPAPRGIDRDRPLDKSRT